jgi:ABC-type branched-subunit amino acid transport system ATPase component
MQMIRDRVRRLPHPVARARALLDPTEPRLGYFSYPDVTPVDGRSAEWLIQAKAVDAGYGGVAVVRGLDLEVRPGEVVALLGPNGAGKTTTLMTLSGLLPLLSGAVWWNGGLTEDPAHVRASGGMAYVTEQRMIFRQLSTRDNLRLARGDQAFVLELFPELERLLDRSAGLLSGGEQQMLALGRAMSRRPTLLLVDELSLGLAPIVVDRLLEAVRRVADQLGAGVILVEQHVSKALEVADRVCVMQRGRIVLRDRAENVRDSDLQETYLSSGPVTPLDPADLFALAPGDDA